MNKEQFFNKYSSLEKAEIERKWRVNSVERERVSYSEFTSMNLSSDINEYVDDYVDDYFV